MTTDTINLKTARGFKDSCSWELHKKGSFPLRIYQIRRKLRMMSHLATEKILNEKLHFCAV